MTWYGNLCSYGDRPLVTHKLVTLLGFVFYLKDGLYVSQYLHAESYLSHHEAIKPKKSDLREQHCGSAGQSYGLQCKHPIWVPV